MTFDPGIVSRGTRSGFTLALRQTEAVEYVNSDEVLAFRQKAGKTYAVLPGREVRTLRSLRKLTPTLEKHGGWMEIGRGYLVNLYRLRRSEKNRKGAGFLLTFDDGSVFPMLPVYEKKVLKFLGEQSLLQVSPISLPQYYLMQMGAREVDKNILSMSNEEATALFAGTGGIVVSSLLVSVLWQMLQSIRAGNPSPVQGGNVRSLYYRVRPLLSRLGLVKKRDPYKNLSDRLAEMVALKICSYREFGLVERGDWSIGLYNPNVIIMAEKRAHYDMILLELQNLTGATIIATGGQPSTVANEYFSEALRKKLDSLPPKTPVAVLAFVDYDPFGWALLNTFLGDMKIFGVPIHTFSRLTLPEHFTPQEIQDGYYDLYDDGKTPPSMIRKWMKLCNGVDGKPWGIEADYLIDNRPRARDLVLQEGKPYYLVPPPVPKRFWQETEKFQVQLHRQADRTLARLRVPRKPDPHR